LYLYKNTTSLSPLDVKSHIGTPFIHLTEIDSTNRYARNQIDANLTTSGTAYFADHQTEGKGRQERSWVSEPGKNILLSIVLNTNGRKNEEAAALNRLVALACFDLFNDFSGGRNPDQVAQ
jgi:BirA family biotin operon repressor/biotin-[acetyl-CoA-carboxylase] ligase